MILNALGFHPPPVIRKQCIDWFGPDPTPCFHIALGLSIFTRIIYEVASKLLNVCEGNLYGGSSGIYCPIVK